MPASGERVILVDAADRQIGTEDKLQAHRTGALHRAVSVFVFDSMERLLLQRRAAGKYHSAGKWSNTCCGHPRPGESVADAATRRLREEMGIACGLVETGAFTYRVEIGTDLIEHEIDHVFVGRFDGMPVPDQAEVDDWEWVALPALRVACSSEPERYSRWLPMALNALRLSPSGNIDGVSGVSIS